MQAKGGIRRQGASTCSGDRKLYFPWQRKSNPNFVLIHLDTDELVGRYTFAKEESKTMPIKVWKKVGHQRLLYQKGHGVDAHPTTEPKG